MRSLFGHIVFNFTSQAENLATEALYYILSNSASAREGLYRILGSIDTRLKVDLYFRTQVYDEDESLPDLVGFDIENDPICIIESKFWAALTNHQPVTYFNRFNFSKPSILLFLVPSKRIDSIWSELVNRCADEGFNLENINRKSDLIYADLNPQHKIGVISWPSLLNSMETEVDVAGDNLTKADLIQLKGLSDQMDEKSFLPVDSKEISPMIAKRNIQFADLIDNAIERGMIKKNFKLDGLRSSAGKYYYGRYFSIKDYLFYFRFDNYYWSEFRNTPFWLEVWGKGFANKVEERGKVKKALNILESDEYGTTLNKRYDTVLVPIELEHGEEKEAVVKSMVNQIYQIYKLLDQNYEK